jgi:hypothetical protein
MNTDEHGSAKAKKTSDGVRAGNGVVTTGERL